MRIWLISFGYLHAPPPAADITQDMRPYRDPHVSPALRQLTGHDQAVINTVLATPGVPAIITALTTQAAANTAHRQLTIAVGCAGGRHRSVVVATTLARRLERHGHTVTVQHRDINRPVVNR